MLQLKRGTTVTKFCLDHFLLSSQKFHNFRKSTIATLQFLLIAVTACNHTWFCLSWDHKSGHNAISLKGQLWPILKEVKSKNLWKRTSITSLKSFRKLKKKMHSAKSSQRNPGRECANSCVTLKKILRICLGSRTMKLCSASKSIK